MSQVIFHWIKANSWFHMKKLLFNLLYFPSYDENLPQDNSKRHLNFFYTLFYLQMYLKPVNGLYTHSRITAADIEPHLNNILTKCFAAMEMEGSQENEYCMKSLMRVVSLAQASLLPCMELLVQKLLQKLSDAARVGCFDYSVNRTLAYFR